VQNGFFARLRYNQFTAADEKIPLSMVPVNRKPQHLVLSCYFGNPASKHGNFGLWKAKSPCRTRNSGVRFAQNPVQERLREPILLQNQG
jgi:hypothetical protein